jgi:hypothetical protein
LSHAERYLELGLRLGRHVDGLVDSYYGPQGLKEQVDAEALVPAAGLAADAAALRDDLPDGWLRDQVAACWVAARVLAGEELSYRDEVEGCYGVRPEWTPQSVFEQAHAELDELLPGDGSLHDRREAWRNLHLCPGDRAVAVLRELIPVFRTSTSEFVELPPGERVLLDAVSREPWWAFNYYQGNLESRVVLNTDVPTTALDLVYLVAHEAYPGHHTEHALKEQLLARDRGLIEESIQLVCTPQAVLSEGIAVTAEESLLGEAAREEAYAIVRRNGVELPDPPLAERVEKALEPLRTVPDNAALMIHEQGASVEEAQAYVERWGVDGPGRARRIIEFVTDPTWRSYTITYSAGRALCRRYLCGDPARFRTLLTEHVRIGELQSA